MKFHQIRRINAFITGFYHPKHYLAMLAAAVTLAVEADRYSDDPADRLVAAAQSRTKLTVRYDPAYRRITYPGGDVPNHLGVCTDVVIRSYRALGIDLQKRVHEDMLTRFADYPKNWGLKRPDTNIDHRRVPNLETFLRHYGSSLPLAPISLYLPGDIVSWRLPNGAPHIGIIDETRSPDDKRPMVIHNIGFGPKTEDMLLNFDIVGHFRYFPQTEEAQTN